MSSLNGFLAAHSKKNNAAAASTHTRMPDAGAQIPGGNYAVPPEDEATFQHLYYQTVFVQRAPEHLTEVQLKGEDGSGPVLVDLDLRYSFDVTSRQHTEQDLVGLVRAYLNVFSDMFSFVDGNSFFVYVMEKPDVNRVEDKQITKDGVHLLFGLQMNHVLQQHVRRELMAAAPDLLGHLPVSNGWNDVFDGGISTGATNWTVYGSRKPRHDAYRLTSFYEVQYVEAREDFNMQRKDAAAFDTKRDFQLLSARYRLNPVFPLRDEMEERQRQMQSSNRVRAKRTCTPATRQAWDENIDGILTVEELHERMRGVLKEVLEHRTSNTSAIEQAHHCTLMLPEKYYEPGSHRLSRTVAFALHRTDRRLFFTWMAMRAKASDFDISEIGARFNDWNTALSQDPGNQATVGVTFRSIIYYAQTDAPEAYADWHANSLDAKIEDTLRRGAGDFDVAVALHAYCGDRIMCANCSKGGTWYTFDGVKLAEDRGDSLRLIISREFHQFYDEKENLALELLQTGDEDSDERKHAAERLEKVTALRTKLKTHQNKNHFISEAKALFYDDNFIHQADENPNLMAFKDCVIDFQEKRARTGTVHDYITKSTNLDYIPYALLTPAMKETEAEIRDFMTKVFPVPEMCAYMWEHTAAALMGIKQEHTLSVYNGSGSNGKSIFVSLVGAGLGNYKCEMPISYIVDKRTKIGSASPEVVVIRGCRYVVMNEPSKNQYVNEGPMKELTGGDVITARTLFCPCVQFVPQATFVVLSNHKLGFRTTDDGTWRRVRDIQFLSKFFFPGDNFTDTTPYRFPADPSIQQKIHAWAPVFMSILVDIAFRTNGKIEPCKVISDASLSYRESQDAVARFIGEMIIEGPELSLSVKALHGSFKAWYEDTVGHVGTGGSQPSSADIDDVFNKRFGARTGRSRKWHGVGLAPYDPESDDEGNP
jgi:P4 family phage/plasmid primase-like protien